MVCLCYPVCCPSDVNHRCFVSVIGIGFYLLSTSIEIRELLIKVMRSQWYFLINKVALWRLNTFTELQH